MLTFKDLKTNIPWVKQNSILVVRHGSHAYGLNTPESDEDIKGVFIAKTEYYLGYLHRIEQDESKVPDQTIYEIRKFFKLAADCNPNIIEVLWVDDEDVLFCNTFGKELLDNKQLFLSTKARHTFSGYAHAQLKRIKTHKKWLLNPVEVKPTRESYGLPNTSPLSADILGAIQSLENKGEDISSFGPLVMTTYQRERAYHNALTEFKQYQNWKENRNPKRAELERKFGYDCKHASHLVRLMRMCKEILTTGKVIVKRVDDREELLEIKNGSWSYDKLIDWAERQDEEMEDLYKKSLLRHEPDRQKLDNLCVDMVDDFLSNY